MAIVEAFHLPQRRLGYVQEKAFNCRGLSEGAVVPEPQATLEPHDRSYCRSQDTVQPKLVATKSQLMMLQIASKYFGRALR